MRSRLVRPRRPRFGETRNRGLSFSSRLRGNVSSRRAFAEDPWTTAAALIPALITPIVTALIFRQGRSSNWSMPMPRIHELVGGGRYLEALRAVRSSPAAPRDEELDRETLWAELAQYTGHDDEAITHAERVVERRPLDRSLIARCHIAIGEVHRNAGRPDAAIERYRQAADEAQRANDDRQLALAELRVLLAMADSQGPEAAAAYVSTVRRRVARVGDPLVTCALHLYLAYVESQRGLFDNATEHTRIGRSLLFGSRHHYLSGRWSDQCLLHRLLSRPTSTPPRPRREGRCASRRSPGTRRCAAPPSPTSPTSSSPAAGSRAPAASSPAPPASPRPRAWSGPASPTASRS